MSSRKVTDQEKTQIKEWIEKVTGEKFSNPDDFHISLKDGVLLCGLISALRCIKYPTYNRETKGIMFKEMENIAFFMQNVQKSGIKLEWTLKALHKNQDMNAVLLSIIDLSNHIKENNTEGYSGPFLAVGGSASTSTPQTSVSTPKPQVTSTSTSTPTKTVSSTSSTATTSATTTPVTTSTPTKIGSSSSILSAPKIVKKNTTPSTPTSTSSTSSTIEPKSITPSSTTSTPSSTPGSSSSLKRFFGGSSSNNQESSPSSGSSKSLLSTPPTSSPTPKTPLQSNSNSSSGSLTGSASKLTFNESSPKFSVGSDLSPSNSETIRRDRRKSVTNHHDISMMGRRSERFKAEDIQKLQSAIEAVPMDDDDEEDDDDDDSVAFNIERLKENIANPSPEFLRVLNQKLENKSTKWCIRFSEEKGAYYLGEIILAANKKYKSTNEKSIQEQALSCCNTLIDNGALLGFIKHPSSITAIAMLLDPKKESVKTRVSVLESLSLVCTFSEQGFWAVLDALNQYKIEKGESKRFFDLADGLKTEKDEKYKTFCLVLFNSLINSPQDTSIRVLLRNELKSIGLDEIVSKLQKDVERDIIKEENLRDQIRAFEEEMMSRFIETAEDSDEEDGADDGMIDVKSIKDPLQLAKLLTIKLGGSAVGITNMRNILQHFLQFSQAILKEGELSKSEKILQDSFKNMDNFLHALTSDAQMAYAPVADIVKSEKMLKILMQKSTKKTKEIEGELERLRKECDSLKKGAKELEIAEDKTKPSTEVAMLTKIMKQQKERIEMLKKQIESQQRGDFIDPDEHRRMISDLENQNAQFLRSIRERDAQIEMLKSNRPVGSHASAPSVVPTVSEDAVSSDVPPPPGVGIPPIPESSEPGVIPPPPPGVGGGVPPPPGSSGGVPPPPGSGGVPPPPGGSSGGVPRPPGGSTAAEPAVKLPELPKRAPKKNVRNFYGDPIKKQKVGGTVWIKDGIAEKTKNIDLDVVELEELFSNVPKEKETKKESKKKKEFVSFIDPTKASNLSILLGYMRLDNEEIKRAILEMDDEVLSQQNIDALKDKTPTEEEIQAIMAYNGDPELLASSDKFYLSIKDVPRLAGRLNCWAFKYKFENNFTEIIPDLETILYASQELQRSKRFKDLLSIILAIANFLNANSAKKDAYGFTLSSLTKLKDTKAVDGKTTLLQYVAIYCTKKAQGVLRLREDFENLERAARISLPDLTGEVIKLKAGVDAIQKELSLPEWQNKKNDKFYKIMNEFMIGAKRDLEEVEQLTNRIDLSLKNLADLYAEDEKTLCKNPSEFFQHLNSFFETFFTGLEEYLRAKIAERKKAQKKERQRMLEKQMQQRKQAAETVESGFKSPRESQLQSVPSQQMLKPSPKRNVHDAIRERKKSIMSGTAFRDKRESRLQQQESNALPFDVSLRKTKPPTVEE